MSRGDFKATQVYKWTPMTRTFVRSVVDRARAARDSSLLYLEFTPVVSASFFFLHYVHTRRLAVTLSGARDDSTIDATVVDATAHTRSAHQRCEVTKLQNARRARHLSRHGRLE